MWSIKEKFLPQSNVAYLGWRVLSIIIIGVLTGSVIMSSYFSYQNIYQTIADANAVVVLSSTVGSDIINIPEYEKAEQFLERKRAPFFFAEGARNIFTYATASSTLPGATSTKK